MATGCVSVSRSEILAILLLFYYYKTANKRLPAKVSKAFPSRPTFNVAELQNETNTAKITPTLTSRHLGSTRGPRVKHFLSSRVNYYTIAVASFQIARLLISGDICPNPGPTPTTNCSICTRTVARNHRAISCDSCTLWCHINCGNVNPRQYKRMQLADDIYWTCPRCLLSALPFADVSYIELVNNLSIANSTQTTETMGQLLHSANTCSPKPAYGSGKLWCLLANARSLRNKLLDFQAAVYGADFDIIAVTETWLNLCILDHEILPSGYQLHRKDRQDRRGGGILFASRSDHVVIRRNDLETDCELM